MEELKQEGLSRRNFLKFAGLTGVSVGLAACAIEPEAEIAAQQPTSTSGDGHQMEQLPPTSAPPTASAAEIADEMDRMHEEGIKIFVDGAGSNPDFWGAPLEYTMDGDTKVFELTAAHTKWEVEAGRGIDAQTHKRHPPGPGVHRAHGGQETLLVPNQPDENHHHTRHCSHACP